jgi:hypothetical protein
MAFHELFAQAGHLYHFLSSFSNCNKSDLKVEVISFSSLKHFGAGYWWLRPVILLLRRQRGGSRLGASLGK